MLISTSHEVPQNPNEANSRECSAASPGRWLASTRRGSLRPSTRGLRSAGKEQLRFWPSQRGWMHQLDHTAQPISTIDHDWHWCTWRMRPRRRRELFDPLSATLQTSRSLTKIFVASRDDRDISLFLEGCINLDIDVSNNSEDINHFVKSEVDNWIKTKRLLYGKLSGGLRDDIKQRLRTQAHRMSVQTFVTRSITLCKRVFHKNPIVDV